MKVTFLTPPALDRHAPAERSAGCTRIVYHMPNIYELTLAAAVEKFTDCTVERRDFVKDGLSEQDFQTWAEADNSDVYVFWTVNLSLATDLLARDIIAKNNPKARAIWVGPAPTLFATKCLTHADDVVVRGEPEDTTCELLNCWSAEQPWENVKGISFINPNTGEITHNSARPLISDLDRLPLPARHFIADTQYHNPKLKRGPYTTMFTSRNCPFHCIYCVPSSLTFARELNFRATHPGLKPTISMRSVESVCEEIEHVYKLGYRAIGFMDDNFIWNVQRLEPIANKLAQLGIVWVCQARVDAINEHVASILGRSGCQYIDLGVESFSQEILDYIKKGITVEQIKTAVALLKKHNVPIKLNVLIGSSPLETKQTIKDTLRQAKRLKVGQVMFNIVAPFPGTEFYDIAKKSGWIKGGDYTPTDVQHEAIINYPHLSAEEMEHLLFRNNLQFFLSPRVIFSHLVRFRSWREFTEALHGLKVKLFK